MLLRSQASDNGKTRDFIWAHPEKLPTHAARSKSAEATITRVSSSSALDAGGCVCVQTYYGGQRRTSEYRWRSEGKIAQKHLTLTHPTKNHGRLVNRGVNVNIKTGKPKLQGQNKYRASGRDPGPRLPWSLTNKLFVLHSVERRVGRVLYRKWPPRGQR